MADQVTKILIRSGTTSARESITLDSAELGYDTDLRRVYAGDGVSAGGNLIGNRLIGLFNLDTEISSLSRAVSGDFVFDRADSRLKALTGTDYSEKDQWIILESLSTGTVTTVSPGAGLAISLDGGAPSTANSITTEGDISILVDNITTGSVPSILVSGAAGLRADWNILYPTDFVIYTSTNIVPNELGGVLEGTGQIWEAAGTSATSGTGASTIYAWKRTG
jgi:hypothetical protein|tara:strand:+ start:9644 stop:10309 length:666 start_codon:yes stop_codon:yes gene_type:complete